MTGKDLQLFHDNIANEEYLHNTIKITLTEIYNLMKECYGPYGSHILIDTNMGPIATKDGKTILSNVHTRGSISNSVLKSITSVADKQVEEVGDGSTTTILLLCTLYNAFRSIIKSLNVSPSVFQAELQKVIEEITTELSNRAEYFTYVNEDSNDKSVTFDSNILRSVIHTSVDGERELTDKILEMFQALNSIEPLVLIDNSPTTESSFELVKGAELSGSIINAGIFFNGLSRANYENPKILVINGRFDIEPNKYLELNNEFIRRGETLIVLATGISEQLIETIIQMNNTSPGMFQRIPVFQITETAMDDRFRDMCAILGATSIDSESTKKWSTVAIMLKSIDMVAGGCTKALLTEFCARFNDPKVSVDQVNILLDDINEKIDLLKNDPTAINNTIPELESRKAFLSRNYAKFYVGGASPQRKAINYELVNDAVPQAISCLKHGIVPGCNVIVPSVISMLLGSGIKRSDLNECILIAIQESYEQMFIQLLANKTNYDNACKEYEMHKTASGYSPLNIREGDDTDVVNSADTDRAILKFSTDMASLLATTKAYLSRADEFDIISKGYDI